MNIKNLLQTIPAGLGRLIVILLSSLLLCSACAPAATSQPTPDINAALTQAVATILAGGTQTAQPGTSTNTPGATSTPAPTAVRTPPALPGEFTTMLLNPLDTPHTYIKDACQLLKAKWDPKNAAPGTVVMPIMFHSITKGDVPAGYDNAISMSDFRKLMKDLKEFGFEAITMQQAADFLYHNAKIPQRSVLLIVDDRHARQYFDDTFANYYKDWGWKVVNGWISAFGGADNVLAGNVELEKEGWVDHQAHGATSPHIPIDPSSTDAFINHDLQGSIDNFKQFFGKTPIAYIWVGGGFTPHSVDVASQVGYKLGFTINPRGPLMFNWVPQADAQDDKRPNFIEEGSAGNPLLTLPRYWDTDARSHLDVVRNISDAAAAYAKQNKATELEYYDIACAPTLGSLSQP